MEPICIWNDGPEGNVEHIAEHDLTPEEVTDVVQNPDNPTVPSHMPGRWVTFGWTQTGRHIAVVWEPVLDDPRTINPITAYEVPEKRSRRRRR